MAWITRVSELRGRPEPWQTVIYFIMFYCADLLFCLVHYFCNWGKVGGSTGLRILNVLQKLSASKIFIYFSAKHDSWFPSPTIFLREEAGSQRERQLWPWAMEHDSTFTPGPRNAEPRCGVVKPVSVLSNKWTPQPPVHCQVHGLQVGVLPEGGVFNNTYVLWIRAPE